MNNGKYNKKSLFNCFKAVVDDDNDFKLPKRRKRGATANSVLTYPAIADEEGVVLFSPGAKEECGNQQRKRGRETWHALRMAINDTTLVVFFHLFFSSFLFFFFSCVLCTYILFYLSLYVFLLLYFLRIIYFFYEICYCHNLNIN